MFPILILIMGDQLCYDIKKEPISLKFMNLLLFMVMTFCDTTIHKDIVCSPP